MGLRIVARHRHTTLCTYQLRSFQFPSLTFTTNCPVQQQCTVFLFEIHFGLSQWIGYKSEVDGTKVATAVKTITIWTIIPIWIEDRLWIICFHIQTTCFCQSWIIWLNSAGSSRVELRTERRERPLHFVAILLHQTNDILACKSMSTIKF